jgi:hypothetical protein
MHNNRQSHEQLRELVAVVYTTHEASLCRRELAVVIGWVGLPVGWFGIVKKLADLLFTAFNCLFGCDSESLAHCSKLFFKNCLILAFEAPKLPIPSKAALATLLEYDQQGMILEQSSECLHAFFSETSTPF